MLDASALEGYIDQCGDRLYRFALALSGNEPDARELVQAAFVKALDRAADYDETKSFETWVMTVLKHLYFDSTKRWERRMLPLDAPSNEEGMSVAENIGDEREIPILEALEGQEAVGLVRRALAGISETARATIMLIDIDGLGYEEAGRALGVGLGTMRSRVNRARAALRQKIIDLEATP